jgi:hypothetical protein
LTRGHQAVLDAEQVVILDAETAAQPIDACKAIGDLGLLPEFRGVVKPGSRSKGVSQQFLTELPDLTNFEFVPKYTLPL